MADGRLGGIPGCRAVARVKNAGAASCEPRVPPAQDDEARPARGERAFVWECRRAGSATPVPAAIVSYEKCEVPRNRIAQNHPVPGVPEGDRVEKAGLVGIGELERPRFSPIARVINPRLVAWTSAQ